MFSTLFLLSTGSVVFELIDLRVVLIKTAENSEGELYGNLKTGRRCWTRVQTSESLRADLVQVKVSLPHVPKLLCVFTSFLLLVFCCIINKNNANVGLQLINNMHCAISCVALHTPSLWSSLPDIYGILCVTTSVFFLIKCTMQ